jgi:hypothetical protein
VFSSKIPGYASLPACYRQVTYFLSIRHIDNSTLEAMRTQGRFSFFQGVATRHKGSWN